jgi:hypothetical protein
VNISRQSLGIHTYRAFVLALVVCGVSLSSSDRAHGSIQESLLPSAETRCESLREANFTSVPDAPTELLRPELVSAEGGTPAYCDVRGYVSPQVGFELRLPLNHWNQKYMQLGTAGWGGAVGRSCLSYLSQGYACAESNSGHQGPGGLWAVDNLQAQLDFGYRAVHVTRLAARAIIERFYAQSTKKSYFMGCSTGGYQGLVEAERFPWDFDGIVAGAPDMDEADLSARDLWARRVMLDQAGHPILDDAALAILHEAALKACDADDGVQDGIIGDSLTCRVPVRDLICKTGLTGQCLTEAQARAAEQMYQGPPTFLPSIRGALPGSERTWVRGLADPAYLDDLFEHMIYGLTNLTTSNFNFDRDYQRLGLAALYTGTNPDLRRFKIAGGKLLVYQGEIDTSEMPTAAVDFYKSVERLIGGAKETESFFRLFMVPAMTHCTGGEGAYMINYLAAMEAWVEHASPPDKLIGLHPSDDFLAAQPLPPDLSASIVQNLTRQGRIAIAARQLRFPLDPSVPITFSRPIYPYPLVAKYRGRGDKNAASSFVAIRSPP